MDGSIDADDAIGELLLNTGDFMSLNSRYKDVCDTILKFRDHKERIIRRTVINLLPRLAAFAPEEVPSHPPWHTHTHTRTLAHAHSHSLFD
jgi:hypothetical protein